MDLSRIIRAYDIRGIFGKELLLEHAFAIGKRFGEYIKGATVVVGFDSRKSSKYLIRYLISGLEVSGCSIINIGMSSSPMLNFAHQYFKTEAAIMVTASHNPNCYNGFKIIKDNLPLSQSKMHEIFSSEANESKSIMLKNNIVIKKEILDIYIRHLIEEINVYIQQKRIKIVWDTAKCIASKIINQLVKHFGYHEHVIINDIIDEHSSADNSDIMNINELINVVRDTDADVGFYFDTDADRILVVDGNSQIIHTDTIMIMLIQDLIEKSQQCKSIIVDYKTSTKVIEYVEKHNIKCLFCRTGHSFIRRSMTENDASLAGESSGHIFLQKNGYDDGIYAAIKIINILSEGKSFATLPKIYITPEIRIEVENKYSFLANVKYQLLQDDLYFTDIHDGIKVILKNSWWVLRCSGTESKMAIRAEGNDESNLHIVKEHIRKYTSIIF